MCGNGTENIFPGDVISNFRELWAAQFYMQIRLYASFARIDLLVVAGPGFKLMHPSPGSFPIFRSTPFHMMFIRIFPDRRHFVPLG